MKKFSERLEKSVRIVYNSIVVVILLTTLYSLYT